MQLRRARAKGSDACAVLSWLIILVAWSPALLLAQEQHERDSTARVFGESISGIPFRVTLKGECLPVERGTRQNVTYFTRFPYTSPVELIVEVARKAEQKAALKPERHADELRREGKLLRINVDDLRPRVLHAEGLPYLFLFPEEPAGTPVESNALLKVIPPNDNPDEHTTTLQSALDQAYDSKGGIIVLKPGIHSSRSLRLRSHTTLHLERGAILRGTGVPEDYVTDRNSRALIEIDQATGSAIRGNGVIDGMGHTLQVKHKVKARLINAVACKDLSLEGIVLQDPGAWTVHLVGCEDVLISRIKVLGDWALSNTDGIDPDMSRNVTIENCFIYSGDDSIVVKTTGRFGIQAVSENIVARDCVLMTKKTALKIGTESRYDIRSVLFEDIDVVDSSRACALWMRDGAVYSEIVFRNIRAPNLLRFPSEPWSGEAYHLSMQERYGQGRMQDILFENVRARSTRPASLFSRIESPLQGITFNNCVWWAKQGESIPPLAVENVRDIRLVDCRIEEGGKARGFPKDLIVGPAKEMVTIE